MDNLDATQLLALVRDVHLPAPPVVPPVWPLVVSTVFVLLTLLAVFILRYKKHPTWIQQASDELTTIEKGSNLIALERTASLLKRIAITHDKNDDVKHLSGDPWLQYLDQFFETDYFALGEGRIFGDKLYQKHNQLVEVDFTELKKIIFRWKKPL